MFRHRRHLLQILLAGALTGCGALLFTYAKKPKSSTAAVSQNVRRAESVTRTPYVQRGALWPTLRKNLEALGDRLEKPGKERLILAGTVRRAGDAAEIPFELIREFPDRLKLVERQGVNQRANITFNGRAANNRSFTPAEADSIETLLFDSVEYFFAGRMEGAPASLLGSKFRLDDGTSTNYTGPFYDIVMVGQQVNVGRIERQRLASYYFNSKSYLLERVRYQRERNGTVINVEVILSDWRDIGGQRLPMRVERFENGSSVLRFTFTAAAVGARVSDNTFNL